MMKTPSRGRVAGPQGKVPKSRKPAVPRVSNPNLALSSIINTLRNNRGSSDAYSRGSLHINDQQSGQEVRLEWESGIPERWWQGLYRVISVQIKASIKGRISL